MKLTFLGTGTSHGVPVIGCDCKVCFSENPCDRRLRASAIVETEKARVLIDCGPDFRQQMIRHFRGNNFLKQVTAEPEEFKKRIYDSTIIPNDRINVDNIARSKVSKIDAVFLTHIHYDHCGGIDDLRPFCLFGDVDIYSNEIVVKALRQTVPYCFVEKKYPGVPAINVHTYSNHDVIKVGDIEVQTISVNHGKMPISAFIFNKSLAYITDMKTIDEKEMTYLRGIDTLVVNALRYAPQHHSHLSVEEAVDFSRKVGAKRVFFTHMCHEIGLHEEVNKKLPEGFLLAYDGQQILIND